MENIRAFYYDFRNKLIQIKIDSDISPLKDYQTKSYDIYSSRIIDYDLMHKSLDNITNKLLNLHCREDRYIYAKLLINNNNAHKTVIEELIDDSFNDKIVLGIDSGIYYIKSENDISIELKNEDYENKRLSHFYKEELIPFENILFNTLYDFGLNIESVGIQRERSEVDLTDIIKSEIGNSPTRSRQFTTKRQTMAIVELLSKLGINTGNVDKTAIAGFIQFLTGKQSESLPQNTTAYKLIEKKDPDSEKEKNSFNNDCDFVASYFESVGLISLADKIKRGKV